MADVRINLDSTRRIIARRNLEPNGRAQQFFTSEVARLCDPYVPMDTGTLKNTRIINTNSITYPQVYAKKNYYENKGRGLRGKMWDKRMWSARGKQITNSVARFAGGHV